MVAATHARGLVLHMVLHTVLHSAPAKMPAIPHRMTAGWRARASILGRRLRRLRLVVAKLLEFLRIERSEACCQPRRLAFQITLLLGFHA